MAQKVTDLAVKAEGGAVAVIDDDLLELGTGLEHLTKDDTSTPFLSILQALSPQLNKNDGKYIKGAEQGNLYNSALGDITDGDVGLIVVPCYYEKRYLEWQPRESGGGLMNSHMNRDILSECTKNDRGQMVLPNGNYIAETAQFYVMICSEDESQWSEAIIAMTSSQLSKAKKWVMQMKTRKAQTSNGDMVDAPMFMYKYRVKTVAEQNDRGSWYGYSIGLEGATTNHDMMTEGKKFLKMIKQGEVEIKHPDASGDSQETQDDVPF